MVVVAVVNRDRDEAVLLEGARRAEKLGTELHVVYVLGLGWYSWLELSIANRVGFPIGLDFFREQCASIADEIAAPVLDEYEPVGLAGKPGAEILEYARDVDADCVVIDGRKRWALDVLSYFRNPLRTLQESDIPVIPVY